MSPSHIQITHKWVYPDTQYNCNFCTSTQRIKKFKNNGRKPTCRKTRFLESSYLGEPFLSLMICKSCWNSSVRRPIILDNFSKTNVEQFEKNAKHFGFTKKEPEHAEVVQEGEDNEKKLWIGDRHVTLPPKMKKAETSSTEPQKENPEDANS